MARRLGMFLLALTIAFFGTNVPYPRGSALAGESEMDAKGEAEAKAALWLYKQGRYEQAANLFAKLSVEYCSGEMLPCDAIK
jgi:hypothetical protein